MEVTTSVAEDAALFGLGEMVSSGGLELRRDGRAVGLWNRDSSSLHPDHNTYGSRPVLLAINPGAALVVNVASDMFPASALHRDAHGGCAMHHETGQGLTDQAVSCGALRMSAQLLLAIFLILL